MKHVVKKYIQENIKEKIVEIIYILLYSFILYVCLESIKYKNVLYVIYLIFNIGAYQYILVSILIVFSFLLFIRSISKNLTMSSIISSTILFIITIVSYYKYKILEQPFVPNDITLIKNINQIVSFGVDEIPWYIISVGIFIAAIIFLQSIIIKKSLKASDNKKFDIGYRIVLLIISFVLIYNVSVSPNRYTRFNIKNDNGDDYFWMGAVPVFFMHIGDLYYRTPKDYNEETINNIKDAYYISQDQNEDANINPNIIILMSESFTNPNKLINIEYSKNPITNLEKIAKEENTYSGEIVTPVLGGGTSLPEFEVLTGLSSYFLPKQIYPYTSYIQDDMNSIVRIFANEKYETIGIHTNTRTFYNRYKIYKYLGFKKTIFEEDLNNPEYKGGYISDEELLSQIIKQYETTNGNKFIFALSMQNHMPYTKKTYENYDIQITNNANLTKTELYELNQYIQGVYDADKAYGELVEYLKGQTEPTILVIFGDHLPSLGSTYSTFLKNGINGINFYTTPYQIWANYNIEYGDIRKLLSPSALAIKILELSNIQIPWLLKPFEELYSKYPVINANYIVDNKNDIIDAVKEEDIDLVKKCELLQFDLLIKKKYIPVY